MLVIYVLALQYLYEIHLKYGTLKIDNILLTYIPNDNGVAKVITINHWIYITLCIATMDYDIRVQKKAFELLNKYQFNIDDNLLVFIIQCFQVKSQVEDYS